MTKVTEGFILQEILKKPVKGWVNLGKNDDKQQRYYITSTLDYHCYYYSTPKMKELQGVFSIFNIKSVKIDKQSTNTLTISSSLGNYHFTTETLQEMYLWMESFTRMLESIKLLLEKRTEYNKSGPIVFLKKRKFGAKKIKRFCVLQKSGVDIYENENDSTPLKHISLVDAVIRQSHDSKNSFIISHGVRKSPVFKCPNDKEMKSWMSILKDAVIDSGKKKKGRKIKQSHLRYNDKLAYLMRQTTPFTPDRIFEIYSQFPEEGCKQKDIENALTQLSGSDLTLNGIIQQALTKNNETVLPKDLGCALLVFSVGDVIDKALLSLQLICDSTDESGKVSLAACKRMFVVWKKTAGCWRLKHLTFLHKLMEYHRIHSEEDLASYFITPDQFVEWTKHELQVQELFTLWHLRNKNDEKFSFKVFVSLKMSEKKKLSKPKRSKKSHSRTPKGRSSRSKQSESRSSSSSQRNRRRWGRLISLNPKHPNADLINQKNFIGRHHKCLISFSSMELSNIHFQIWLKPPPKINSSNLSSSESKPMVFIQDLSTNGTFLNGKLVGKNNVKRLKNGDEITLVSPHYDTSKESKTIAYMFQDYSIQLFQKALEKTKRNFQHQQTLSSNSVKQKSKVLEGDRGIIQTPQKFVDQLRYHLIPNVLATLYKVIQLQTSSWITEFFELGGLDLLIESLRFRIEKSRRNQTDRSIETHIVQCLKLLMDKKVGLQSILKHPKTLETLVLSLYNDNVPSKCHALKILTVPLVVNQESYDKVLAGFSQAVEYGYERIRFQRLVRTFELIDDLKYRQRLMLLINFIIVTPEDVMVRMQMRREFIACGLEKYFDDVLYPMQEIKITRQLRFFINEKEKDDELVQLGKIDLTDPNSLIQAIVQQTQGSTEYQNLLKVLQGLLTIQHDENSKQKWNAVQSLVQKSAIREKINNEDKEEKEGNIQNQVIVELERQKISSLEEQVQKLSSQITNLEKTNKNLLKGIKTSDNTDLQGEEDGDDFSRFDDNIKTNKVQIDSPKISSRNTSTNEKTIGNEKDLVGKLNGGGIESGSGSVGGGIPPPPMIGGGLPPPPDLRKQKWKDQEKEEGGGGIPPSPMIGGGGNGLPPPPDLRKKKNQDQEEGESGGGTPPPPMGGGIGMPPPPSFGKKRGLFGKKKPNVKMKQLFWSKINKKQVDKTIWSDVSKFIANQNLQANVKNLEEHFCARRKLTKKEKKVIDEEKKERAKKKKAESIKLIEPSKAQTVEMILKRWKYSHEEVKEAILKMDDQKFDIDKLKTLIKIMPDETQQETVNSFSGDVKRLGEVEKFYRLMGTIPSLEKRLAAFEFKLEFHVSLKDVHQDIEQIIEAAKSISESEGLRQIFALILISGNYMNMGTSRGNCLGFKLDFLVRLASTKSIDNKMSLIQFCCLEAERLGLGKVLSLSEDLFGLRKVIGKPIEMIQSEANQIKKRIEENDEFLKSFKKSKGVFYKSLFSFLKNTRKQMKSLGSLMDKMEKEYNKALSIFGIGEQDKMVSTEYFSMIHNFVLEVEQGIKANIKERELQEKKIKDEKRKIAQQKRRDELKNKKNNNNNQQSDIKLKTPKKSSKSPKKNNFKNLYGTIKQGRLIRKDNKQDLNLMNFMQQAKLARSSLKPINSDLEGIQKKK
ncbi:protein diaphanous [Anaeramoeba flamelloides]|uniref:Protein diaphanous n=1 Tax=Anaeramoeba flamelloides TaxID=1746091 RepID=A0AAV8A4A4_9EUKA|nr:protein diaphanous [Anaeramoeba flamelloides]